MKIKQKILILFSLFLSLFSVCVYAGEQEWNSLDYDVTLNQDGSADIVETWDVDISETNTMFKDFDLSSDNYYINNVRVTEVVNGEEIALKQIYEEQYHVQSGCYYGLMKTSNTFEIAWNVGLDNSSDRRVYKMYYTVKNAVKTYSDCSEFYWQFISNENTMTGDNITGRIYLPVGITDLEKLHIWGHGDFSGNTERTSTREVSFNMKHLRANSMLEIRVVSEDNIFELSTNTYGTAKLSSILNEEARWAEEANREKAIYKTIISVVCVIVLISFVIYFVKILKYIQAGKELKMQKYKENGLQYFRDIPDEKNATPARASYMYYFNKTNSIFEYYTANIFSATLLQLTLKKYISLEPINDKNIKINILEDTNENLLTADEEIIYNFLVDNSDKETKSVETVALQKYAKKHYEKFHKMMDNVCVAGRNYEENRGIIDLNKKAISDKWINKGVAYAIACIFSFGIMMCALPLLFPFTVLIIEFIICMIMCFINAGYIIALTAEGYEEMNQWKALKKYMEDFSLLKEKQVPDLILWEKYLVYATTFGISKKVLEQLIKVYPQMTSEDYYYSGHYTYLYIASNSGFDTLSNLDRSFSDICQTANSAYSAAHSSSSGGGGGFSGGGGGRRWWRKLWWQITLK